MCINSVLQVHISLHVEAVTRNFCTLKCFTNQYNRLLAEEDSDVKTILHSSSSCVCLRCKTVT